MTKEKAKEPQIRFKGFTNAWEQRKVKDLFKVSRGYVLATTQTTVNKTDEMQYPVYSSQTKDEGLMGYYKDYLYEDAITWTTDGANAGTVNFRAGKFYCTNVCGVLLSDKVKTNKMIAEELNDIAKRYVSYVGNPKLMNNVMSEIEVSLPKQEAEQEAMSSYFATLDTLITLHQRKCDLLSKAKKTLLQKMFPKNGKTTPEIRFKGFTGAWEQRKLGEEFEKVNERNDGSFGREHWISVAKMYFQDPDKVQSNNIDTRTYVMRKGDIAFEGHPNVDFKFGRFVANDIGAGVVSELFPIYRHKQAYDNNYWKHAIQLEHIMAPIFAHSITSSGNSSNKLDSKHFLRQKISVPKLEEQKQIGSFFANLDHLITIHQHELEKLQNIKKSCLKMMFV
ncbi:Putative type-1 restriction enzyme specificity protein MPN_089 [Eubacterium limosum]|uniref:Type-1 restriction enzyme specificity protein MPN_089 n=1 Tax=Eubacterium limosum TaxID=1736 RepID=A0A6N3EFQ2_EUBLI